MHHDTDGTGHNRLLGHNLTVGYDNNIVLKDLTTRIPSGAFTVIIGPNGCGKSTLLRALSRLIKPTGGHVVLCGKDIRHYSTKDVACILGFLPQSATVPEGITVSDLVERGRYPHQSLFKRRSSDNEQAITDAIKATSLTELRHVPVESLSGGQRQRAWIAMVLAQQTSFLLLDEPTTFLDISHQIELLELFRNLKKDGTRTIIGVLHDLNHASRYADNLIVMKQGQIVAEGVPNDIVTADLVEEVFGLKCLTLADPVSKTPMVVPL